MLTLIDQDGRVHRLPNQGRYVDAAALTAATGWVLKPEGLCRGYVCVPLRVDITDGTGRVDLVTWAQALGLPLAYDEEVAAITTAPSELQGDTAPDLTLPDVDGKLHSFGEGTGHKRVLTTWASWCGCRHELPAWQALHDELAPKGLRLFAVALDEPDSAAPWIESAGLGFPAVVDRQHVTADRFGITNVPSTVWVDEDDRIVKPPTIAPGDDQFVDFTQVPADRHHDALRRWVATGELPDVPKPTQRTYDEQLALAHRRVAAHLHGEGRPFAHHLARAAELAPLDWTVRRGGIAMKGGDPFLGDEFLEFWAEWDQAGRPGYTPT
jgi:peroxiredoxin